MRRAPALAGTFFNNWANYGFKETVKQTREWVRGARSGAAATGETRGPAGRDLALRPRPRGSPSRTGCTPSQPVTRSHW